MISANRASKGIAVKVTRPFPKAPSPSPGAIVNCVKTADSLILNWAGEPGGFPEVERLNAEAIYKSVRKKRTC